MTKKDNPCMAHRSHASNKKLRDAMLRRIEEAEDEEDDFTTSPPTAAEQLADIVSPPVRRPGRPRKN